MELSIESKTAMTQTDSQILVPLRIKGMMCARCIEVIQNELTEAGFKVLGVQLGQLTLEGPLLADDIILVKKLLSGQGFSLIEDQKNDDPSAR